MKKIGFIDYFLDEWHANHYPQWLREEIQAMGLDMEVAYAWADIDKPDGLGTSAWCEKTGMERLPSIEAIVEKSDCLIVLSPDHAEHHERLARRPLMSGKPVYIDKTFSPDLETGIRMFDLAEKYATPMFSSSALRFASELSNYPDSKVNRETLESVAAFGPGSYSTYAVHQYEMVVSMMGAGAKRIKSLSTANNSVLSLDYGDGRRASIHQMKALPFMLAMQMKDGDGVFVNECSDIFQRLIHVMLDFFNTGKLPVPREETLEVMALIEAGGNALMKADTWVKIGRKLI